MDTDRHELWQIVSNYANPSPAGGLITMPITFYTILHIAGIIMVFMPLAAIIQHISSGGDKSDNPRRKQIAITHGIGVLLILISGFGMLAKLGIHWPWPGWVFVKFGIWLLLSALIGLAYRFKKSAEKLWLGLILIGVVAAVFGLSKPF